MGFHVEGARLGQVDVDPVGHARRSGGKHDDPGAEKHRLRDAVGDEQDGLAALLPDAQQLQVHALAGQRVERPERLVHQDQAGIVDQRPGDGGALLHAAGEFVGIFLLVAGQPDHVDQAAGALARLAHGQAEDFRRQQDIFQHPPPFQQQRLLEHHADIARRVEIAACAADLQRAAVVGKEPGNDLEQGGLAAARRPDDRHQLAFVDVEGGVGNREEFLAAGAEDLLDANEADEGFAACGRRGGHTVSTRASRTTTRRSSPRTIR